MIINIEHKNKWNENELITIDFRLKQLRFVREKKDIYSVNLSNDDLEGFIFLFNHDRNLFFKSVKDELEDFHSFIMDLDITKMKILNEDLKNER